MIDNLRKGLLLVEAVEKCVEKLQHIDVYRERGHEHLNGSIVVHSMKSQFLIRLSQPDIILHPFKNSIIPNRGIKLPELY